MVYWSIFDKYVALSNLSIYYTWENIKESCKSNRFRISALKWYEEFELSDGWKSVSDIQDFFLYIIKTHVTVTDNTSTTIDVNKIENRITSTIKAGYYLEVLTNETIKLLESTKNKITKDANGENVPNLEITEVVLVHSNIVNNDYQQDSTVSDTFVTNKSFGWLLDISSKHFMFLKTFDSELLYIEV